MRKSPCHEDRSTSLRLVYQGMGADTNRVDDLLMFPQPVYCGPLVRDTRTGQVFLAPGHGIALIAITDPSNLVKIDRCP